MATRINVDLNSAFALFVSFLDAQQNTDLALLDDIYQKKLSRLDQYMETLTELAQNGLEDQLPPLLGTLLKDWAIKEAAEMLIQDPYSFIDPYNKGLQQDFWQALQRQHQALSSELLLQLDLGKQRRSRDWHSLAKQSVEEQRLQHQQAVQREQQLNQQWLSREQAQFDRYDQSNQRWANVAMSGLQQAQNGVQQNQAFAAQIHGNIVGMLNNSYQQQGQVLTDAVYEAEKKKRHSKLKTIFFICLGALVVLYLCGLVSQSILMGVLR